MDYFEIIENEIEIVIEEKKSKFITRLFKVKNKKDVDSIIEEIKRKEKQACHNCYAFRLLQGTTVIEGRSDDGEPSGTAGAPMLEVLKSKKLVNILAVTTRYFGGIKLGTGGLVKAYTDGVVRALEKCKIEKYIEKGIFYLILDHQKYSMFYNYIKKNNINIVSEEIIEDGKCKKVFFEISKKEFEQLKEKY